jgi:prepilin-type N-terminal cleavage/methylation domain-containing protein
LSSSRKAKQGHTRREAGSQSQGTSVPLVRLAASAGTSSEGSREGPSTTARLTYRPGGQEMLARLRKTQEENEGGFTLIELLVVMIIIGILAAIAIPVFLNQRKKAQDTAAKADVSTIGKELATYYVDNTGPTTVVQNTSRWYVAGNDAGAASANVALTAGSPHFNATTPETGWCVSVTNANGSQKIYKYSAANGLQKGDCTSGTDY